MLDGKKIIATDHLLADKKEAYRKLWNEQALCPICQEHIKCRFGLVNQHHFAHRHTSDCPGDHDTAEHRDGKIILYEFLLSRYGHEANIDIEHYFTDIKMTCDFLIEFKDGRRWALEFDCGICKETDLKKKLQYYNDHEIKTTWLIAKKFLKEYAELGVRISRREQLLIVNTGIDKLYIEDWYTQIVVNRQRRALPKDSHSRGSLIYFDVEQKEIIILRAIRPEDHHNVFYYGSLLRGSLKDVCIKTKKNKWGVVWYFAQEKELWPKYKEAEKVLKELESEHLRHQKLRAEVEAKQSADRRKEYSDDFRRGTYGTGSAGNGKRFPGFEETQGRDGRQDDFGYDSGWGTKAAASPLKYRCIYCGREFKSGDMVIIPHYNIPEGTCRECGRKGYNNLKGRI
jgi:DNA-directed RNA polymerase subunit RPC12/RpoP